MKISSFLPSHCHSQWIAEPKECQNGLWRGPTYCMGGKPTTLASLTSQLTPTETKSRHQWKSGIMVIKMIWAWSPIFQWTWIPLCQLRRKCEDCMAMYSILHSSLAHHSLHNRPRMIICGNGYQRDQPTLGVFSVLKGMSSKLACSAKNRAVGTVCVALVGRCIVGVVAGYHIEGLFTTVYRNGPACSSKMLDYGRWVCDYV